MGELQQATGRVPRKTMLFRLPRRSPVARAAGAAPLVPGGGRRKRKMAVARLGGKRRFFGAIRRLRVRWLAALYRRTLRRLRAFYTKALVDLLEGAAVMGQLRGQAGADCSFGTAFAPVVTVGM
ncbi:hypothetical protein QOZ80_2AG0148030 [Eleusine coracana subsp. coracana]|nr:hypothetical protein QOZ80_2AG0148030 [Eleusine coracana subsp. coracana]